MRGEGCQVVSEDTTGRPSSECRHVIYVLALTEYLVYLIRRVNKVPGKHESYVASKIKNGNNFDDWPQIRRAWCSTHL